MKGRGIKGMLKLLLVEDDQHIVKTLGEILQNEGFEVQSASEQTEALKLLDGARFDIVLLDVSLKEGNGFAVCSAVKREKDIPVIFLTALGDEYSVVTGLELGADDYVAKPFRPRELISRIKSVLRRTGRAQTTLTAGDISVDTERGAAYKKGKELCLSALEYRLLLAFFNNRGAVLTRDRLLDEIWDASGDFVNDNTLTVYIKRLREKIEDDPQNPVYIKTARGMGYRMDN